MQAPRISQPPHRPALRRNKQKKKDQTTLLLFFFFLFFPTLCAGALGFAFFRAGYIPSVVSYNLTATALAKNNAGCRALIEKAMQVSNNTCDQIDSNKVCYGNDTITAEFAPGTTQQLLARGDIADINQVRRLSASPLKLDSGEWGVAVLKVIANLPRSQPGQTVTMIVFGNTTLDNQSDNLESFFFSSELGQIVCDKVPDDGIMISVPKGEGVRFTVNGSELTLAGDASMKAVRNGKMEVSLFEGSGRIVSDGHEEYFGAGQQVNVQLGGENGTESVGPPSEPESLSQEDLDTACALTGQFCSPDEIAFVSSDEAQNNIKEELGIVSTQTATLTFTPTLTPSPTVTATNTLLVLPSWTPSKGPPTQTAAPRNTRTPAKTPTRISTPLPTDAPTLEPPTPESTSVVSTLVVPTQIPSSTATNTATQTPTSTATDVPTFTPAPTAVNTPIGDPACSGPQIAAGALIENGNSLTMDLTNNTGAPVTIDALHIVWDTGVAAKILDQFLSVEQIGNANSLISPSDFPSPNPFTGPISRRQIEVVGTTTETLVINFQSPPTGGGYIVQIHFDIGCQIQASK